jgi:hypothetical protein
MKWGVLFASTGFPDPVSAVELCSGPHSDSKPAVRARSGDELEEELARFGAEVIDPTHEL